MAVFSKKDDDSEHTGTYYWLKYIRNRIKNNKNFMAVFIGQTGSGKSYSMLGLSDKLQDGGIKMNNIFLKASKFLEKLVENNLNKGDVLCWDETGVDLNSKQWQSKTNRMINTVMQVFRKENLIVLFTLPYFSFLDSDARKLVHAVFETMGIDRNTNEVILKPKLVQVNQDTGKLYKKFLRVKVPGKGIVPIKKIRIGLIDAEKLKIYEQLKDEFIRKLYQDAYNSVNELDKPKLSSNKPVELTERQSEVLKLTEEGYKQIQIAKIMQISQRTVSEYLNIARKKRDLNKILEKRGIYPPITNAVT